MTYRNRSGETVVARLSIGNWIALAGILLPVVLGGFASWMDLRASIAVLDTKMAVLDTKMTAHEKRLDNLEVKKSDGARSLQDGPESPLQASRPAVSFAH